MGIGPIKFSWLDVLLVFVVLSIVLEVAHASPVLIFVCACLAIIPLAGWMGKATEHLAAHFGSSIGGLLNATFGNAAELIIALFALHKGLYGVVKASLTGSIIGNILLVLGLSLLLGGVRHRKQKFNPTGAGLGSTLLLLSAIGLVVPAVFAGLAGERADGVQDLSLEIAIVLFVAYMLSLFFSLVTHRDMVGGDDGHGHDGPIWSRKLAAGVLVGATALIALMSEFLVGSVEHTAEAWGLTEVFIGVIVVAIIGNAAEHSTAIIMAMKNKMDIAMNIAIGSGIQIALLIAPLLVFVSYGFHPDAPMDLIFTPFEVIAVVASVVIVSLIAHDGVSHWMEGVLLLAVYVIMAFAFYHLPA